MTVKRFTLWRTLDLDGHTDEWDIIDNTRLDVDEGHICEEEVVELLNALHEENQALKQHIQNNYQHIKRLENTQIKTYTTIKEAYNNERTTLGKSVLKQLINQME